LREAAGRPNLFEHARTASLKIQSLKTQSLKTESLKTNEQKAA